MKQIEKISEGANYTAVSVGKMDELGEHKLVLAPGVEMAGKVFAGSALQTTGAEISFQIFEPNQGSAFVHDHKNHEELYIFIKGKGEFQIDGKVFPVSEGTIVRVAPGAKRAERNTGDEPLIMICIQYKSKSFDASDAQDGIILDGGVNW